MIPDQSPQAALIRKRDRMARIAALQAHNAEEYEERAATARREARKARALTRELEAEFWARYGFSLPNAPRTITPKLGKLASVGNAK